VQRHTTDIAARPLRIVLTGYMGAGKSTIGRLLAKALGYTQMDTDNVLSHRYQLPVTQLFEQHGEAFFRQAEATLLNELLALPYRVISTGGGTLSRIETLQAVLNAPSTVLVYLRVPISTLYDRVIFSHKDRPLLNLPNCEAVFHERFAQRESFYQQAHIVVDSNEQRPEQLLEAFIFRLSNYFPQWDMTGQLAFGKQLQIRRLQEQRPQPSLHKSQHPLRHPLPPTTANNPDQRQAPLYNKHGGREFWSM
jgi:shikimate kinase